MTKFILFLAFYVAFFTNLEGYATDFQILAAGLIGLAALTALSTGQVRKEMLSAGEMLAVTICVFSAGAGLITFSPNTLVYTLVFGVVFVSIGFLRRAIPLNSVLEICAYAFVAAIFTILATDFSTYLRGLSGEVINGSGLLRFRPLGLHPNLSGFLFGAGAILLYRTGTQKSGINRFLLRLAALISFSFVLAASARAGLVAVLAAFLITKILSYQFRIKRMSPVQLLSLGLLGVAMVITIVTKIDVISEYSVRILDLNNPLRGLDSGATGRVDLWIRSLSELQSRGFIELFFGSGLRSSSGLQIGYSTESSYFTLLLEHGIWLATLCVFGFGTILVRMCRRPNSSPATNYIGTVALLLAFAMVQSVFNRYLLAVGNPFSILLIFFYFSALRKPS